MLALDTEDDSKGKVTIINFFDGDNHYTFSGKNCRYQSWNFLHTIAPKKGKSETIWACNTEYDLINLFGPWVGKLLTLQYVSSGLMRATFKEARIIFLDTLRHWPMSVEAMGNYIGLPKLHRDFSSEIYCQRDTEIVWKFVIEMTKRYEHLDLKIKSTLPSMALQLFKQFYVKEFQPLNRQLRSFFRKGYYGGRVEVYRFGKILGPVNHYDVNSLFPSVMYDFPYPDTDSWKLKTEPNLEKEGIFEGWIMVPETEYPCLPVRQNGEIVYPHGAIYGIWPYPEIRQSLKDGGVIVKCRQVVEFENVEIPFRDYVKYCYDKRQRSDNALDNVFWKLMLNSLYGKFGSWNGLTIISNDQEFEVLSQANHANIIWSAYVTSYARLRLLDFLRSCAAVYYTDTDSLFTPDNLVVSQDLGKLKQEGCYPEVEFTGNKIYRIVKDGGDNFKAKGVPNKLFDAQGSRVLDERGLPVNPAADFIRTGKAIYRKPVRFRESRKAVETGEFNPRTKGNYWYDVEKNLKKKYTKRKVFIDGTTEPWEINDYLRFKRENKQDGESK